MVYVHLGYRNHSSQNRVPRRLCSFRPRGAYKDGAVLFLGRCHSHIDGQEVGHVRSIRDENVGLHILQAGVGNYILTVTVDVQGSLH